MRFARLAGLAHSFLLGLAVRVEARLFARELLLDLLNLLEFLRGEGLVELFFQEDFALGQLALVNAVDFREAGFLLGREWGGGGFRFGETLHREFISAFHGR